MAASQTVKVIFDGKDNTSKAIASLNKNLGKANTAVSKIKSSLGGMTGAIGLAAGAAGFGALAKSALDSADKLGKASERMQVAASDLSSLQLAASYAGVEADQFTKLMEIFQKRIGEAAQGTGEAAGVLRQFGIDAKEFAKLPLDTQLQIIADNMNTLEDATARSAAASDLFSNRGIKLLNFFNLGSKGIKELREEFRDLGMEISDKQIDNIEAFNDSMTKLKAIINQAMIVGLAEAAPEMEAFAEKAAQMAVPLVGNLMSGLQFIIDNAQAIANGLKIIAALFVTAKVVAFTNGIVALGTVAFPLLTSAAVALYAALGPISLILGGISAAAVYFKDDIAEAAKGLGLFSDESDGAADSTKEITEVFDEFGRPAGSLIKNMEKAGVSTGELDEALESLDDTAKPVEKDTLPDLTDGVVTLAKEEQDAAKETLELKEALEKLRDKAIKPQRDLEQFTKKMEMLQKQLEETDGSTEDLERQMAELVKEFTGVSDEVQDVRDEIKDTKTALDLLIKSGKGTESQIKGLEDKLDDLGKELVEAIGATSTLTDSQNALLDELSATDDELDELNGKLADLEALYAAGAVDADTYKGAVASINAEIAELNKADLSPFQTAVANAFGTTEIGGFIDEIEKLTGQSGLIDSLVAGFGEVATAEGGCFGTGRVTAFGDAIKALGQEGGVLKGLEGDFLDLSNAIGDFFGTNTTGVLGKIFTFAESAVEALASIAAAAIASVGINFLKALIPGLAYGGEVEGFASGGRVFGNGGPKEDKVPAMLSPGEYVIRASSVSKFGSGFFDALNSGKMPGIESMLPGFSTGGLVQKFLSGIFGYFGAGYNIDNPDWATYLLNMYEQLSQTDPRDDPMEAYDTALEIIVFRIAKAISDAYAMIDETFGTQIASADSVGDVIGKVVAPLGALTTQGFLNEFDVLNKDSTVDGIRDEFFNALFGIVNGIKISPLNFNVDDKYLELFNSANQVAGGRLEVTPRQFGGPLDRGQASLVGEDGPELFIPDNRGRVSPIATDGGRDLIEAVREVKNEVAALRRQMDRQNPVQLLGGRSA